MSESDFIPFDEIQQELQTFGPAPTLLGRPAAPRSGAVRASQPEVVVRSHTTAAPVPLSPPPPSRDPGRSLVTRGGPVLREHFAQVVWFESGRRDGLDYDVPALLAARAIEACLRTWVTDPFDALPPIQRTVLIDELGKLAPSDGVRNTLEGWRDRHYVTLGTFYNLLALFQQCEAVTPSTLPKEIRPLLLTSFSAVCCDWLLKLDLKKTLRCIQNTRNNAAHASKTVVPREYEQFAEAAVAHHAFTDWYNSGPRTVPLEDDRGLLHHLLAGLENPQSPSSAALPAVFDRLPAVLTAPASLLSVVGIDHHSARAGAVVTRHISTTTPAGPRPFHLGDQVDYTVYVSKPAWVRVYDCDPDHGITQLWPNKWDRDRQVTPSMPLVFPDGRYPRQFWLQGTAGEKWLVVRASEEPFRDAPIPPGQDLRDITPTEMLAILDSGHALAALHYIVQP